MSRDKRPDWRAELGRHEGRSAHETLNDQIAVFRLLFRLLILPIWLPMWFWRVEKRRREMRDFALERLGDRTPDDEAIREVVLAWAEAHKDRYPLGEYDPRLGRLHRTLRNMLAKGR